MRYTLNERPVNAETFIASLLFKTFFLVLSVLLFAWATSFSVAESFGLAGAAVMLGMARKAEIMVE